jgi:hypothetical protein
MRWTDKLSFVMDVLDQAKEEESVIYTPAMIAAWTVLRPGDP